METSKKYKIAVFSDLKRDSENVLKSAVGLASTINGDIEVFHVKGSAEVVKTDNQFSALRSIKDEFAATERKLLRLIQPISEEYGLAITHRLGFGNVKNEIQQYIETLQPDLVILGRRNGNPFDFMGDGITQFVLETHEGILMIASKNHVLEPTGEISLGLLNGIEPKSIEFYDRLMGRSKKPLKSFSFIDSSKTKDLSPKASNANRVEFVFEKGENAMKNLSKYLSKNSINLLCVDRNQEQSSRNNTTIISELKNLMGHSQVSLLVSGKSKIALH